MAPQIEGLSDLVEVGRGGFGVVYRAVDTQFNRKVAVKVLNAAPAKQETQARFMRECQALGALSGHPNIVAVYQSGATPDGQLYMSMEFLSGDTAGRRVNEQGPATPLELLEWGTMLAGALETAHRAGIIHRDVKPANILFSSFGTPKLVDFGIARMNDAFETSTGQVTATLNHAAPEVLEGKPASPSADIYALASTLHQLATGYAPFHVSGETSLAPLISRISTMPAPDLRQFGVPGPLAEVIARGLSKTPQERYQSAGEMGEALRRAAITMGVPPTTLPIASDSDIADAARIEASAPSTGLPGHPYRGAAVAADAATTPSAGLPPQMGSYAAGPGAHVSAPTPLHFAAGTVPGRQGHTGQHTGSGPSTSGPHGGSGSGSGSKKALIAGGIAAAVIAVGVGVAVAASGGDEGANPDPGPTSSTSTWTSQTPTTDIGGYTSPTSRYTYTPSPTTKTYIAPQASPVTVGKEMPWSTDTGQGTFVVHGVKWVPSSQAQLGGASNGYLLILDVSIKVTKGSTNYNSLNFSAINDKGEKVRTTLLLDYEPHLNSGLLKEGQTTRGNVGFDVAKEKWTVTWSADTFSQTLSFQVV